MSVPLDAILALATAGIGLVSTFFGVKYQNAANLVSTKTAQIGDLTSQINKIVVAAKDSKIDENAFQAMIDDVYKLISK
jgi:hypothetical protein